MTTATTIYKIDLSHHVVDESSQFNELYGIKSIEIYYYSVHPVAEEIIIRNLDKYLDLVSACHIETLILLSMDVTVDIISTIIKKVNSKYLRNIEFINCGINSSIISLIYTHWSGIKNLSLPNSVFNGYKNQTELFYELFGIYDEQKNTEIHLHILNLSGCRINSIKGSNSLLLRPTRKEMKLFCDEGWDDDNNDINKPRRNFVTWGELILNGIISDSNLLDFIDTFHRNLLEKKWDYIHALQTSTTTSINPVEISSSVMRKLNRSITYNNFSETLKWPYLYWMTKTPTHHI